ncbi:MAG TPA: NAD(P)/FAD-dependent oxidoreductase [Anaerolineae bacterium]|nr:NAD(P)/FAD-dependent oxidoreductase [Anaerolineae bacterium]
MSKNRPHVVIIGGGFGGLYAAKQLAGREVRVTLIDKRNFHLFQPLLYQVATGGLSPGDITSPLRSILKKAKNVQVLAGEVTRIEPRQKLVYLGEQEIQYNYLIVATGVTYHYFGQDGWRPLAPGLKSVEDALEMRRNILHAFEMAEKTGDEAERRAWLTFVVVGAGATGVELAGALGELANKTLSGEFRRIDPKQTRIVLVEGEERVLPPFTRKLSLQAADSLADLGVEIMTQTMVDEIREDGVTLRSLATDKTEELATRTVLWAAGVKVAGLGEHLAEVAEAETDRMGRIMVNADMSVGVFKELFVLGDLAHYAHQTGEPLPGVAQVAMQQGKYVAKLILAQLEGSRLAPFKYNDKGNLAVIGRNSAVAHIGRWEMSGFPAWLIWILVHIHFLIEFDNKILVLVQWAWNYWTRKRGARLITGLDDKE